jgi:hypothetical protein
MFGSSAPLHELQHALERQEARLGVSGDDDNLSDDVVRALQAAWERAEMARIEIDNGHPHLSAQALLSMNSALDALIEEFVPSNRSAAPGPGSQSGIVVADAAKSMPGLAHCQVPPTELSPAQARP